MLLYSLVPSFRSLLAPVPRLKLRTDTQTHTQDNYRNPPAHARRGLINASAQLLHLGSILLTLHKFKVWMTIVESGWNVWVWLVGVVSRRQV